MIKIDWSMAPEWADGHGLIAHQGITEVWISMDQYAEVGRPGGPYPWGGGTGDTRHNHTRGRVEYITPRPARWDGEGLPPVGVEFEYTTNAGYNWHRGRALFLDSQVVLLHGYHLFKINDPDLGFRPLRTPEQVAAEEREKALNELTAGYAPHTEILRQWAARAYDELGYRKQEAS